LTDVRIGNVTFGNKLPLALIAGPCQLESRDHALMMAEALKTITDKLGIGFVFKASFDKANRTSADSPRGAGIYQAVKTFREIKALGIPTLTDIHENWQVEEIALAVDCLQIPALLCRQTNLLKVAAMSRMPINVKKGQFMAPHDMQNVVDKLNGYGNQQVLLTERGTSFGYNDLVADMRSMGAMGISGCPIIFDATHSSQMPGGLGRTSGGDREVSKTLAKAAVATSIAGIFIETHQDPDNAPSDGPCMTKLSDMEELLKKLIEIDQVVKDTPHVMA
jgi:2-dehydro-3-deoxyphosphooctonate aldolase (KDO 8-P synthase)